MILSSYNLVAKNALILFTFFLFISTVQGQIMITSGEEVTPMDLVENIIGEGVQYSNVSFQGAEVAKGVFSNGFSTNIGIDGGIILSSGYASILQGPNFNTGATGYNGTPGDATLTGLANQSTFDAAVLEFDFIPESDTLRFKYVFGSEEYPEYVTNLYNDLFGFFVTGPNPDGGEYMNENVAVVPGSSPPLHVSIATINDVYPSYEEFYIDNAGGLTIEYDGFTVVLTAFIKVVACEQYHIKMAVADAGDGILDTGMCLKENSFESPKIEVQTDPYPEGVSDNMIEGCVEADIIFLLPNDSYAPISIPFEITTGPGYATTPEDFTDENGDAILPIVTFEAGEDSTAIHVVPIKDNVAEGEEIIEFIITNDLGCIVRYDTVQFIITDYVDMVDTMSPPTVICQGQEIDVWVNVANGIPPYSYTWEPEESENDTITVSPEETTQYIVTYTDMCLDTISDSTTVTVFPTPIIDLGPDTVTLCEDDTLKLNAGGGYLTYVWNNEAPSPDSTYNVTSGGPVIVTVYGPGGCAANDTMFVEEIILNIDIGPADTVICEGDSLVLTVGENFDSYQWQDGSSGLTMTAKDEGMYWVIVSGEGCTKKDSLYLYVDDPSAAIELGNDTTICQGEYITIGPSGISLEYLWNTGDTTATIEVTDPGTYILQAVGACGDSQDEIVIDNWDYPNPALGPDIFLCNGQYDYLIAQSGFYSYSWNNQPPSSDNELLVSETNYYYVQVEDYHGCIGNDTVFVEVGNLVELGEPSMILCEGDSIILDAGSEFDYYNWNGVPGEQKKVIYQGGIYKVDVGYNANAECVSEDQVTVDYYNLPVAEITSGDFLCDGDTMWLRAPNGSFTYYWNDEQSDNSVLIIENGGNYTLKMGNICGFDSTEKVIEQRQLPGVNLGEDQLLFPEESLTLDAGVFESYEWNNDPSLNDQFYTVTAEEVVDTSTIYVQVFDGYCYNKDGVFVEIFNVKVPTVITPNGDGDNDLFEPFDEGWAGIHSHTITVFNRWGEQVWQSNDFPSGWDGQNNGTLVADGTYFWVLDVSYGPDNVSKSYKGTLTVLGTGQ